MTHDTALTQQAARFAAQAAEQAAQRAETAQAAAPRPIPEWVRRAQGIGGGALPPKVYR